MDAAAVCAHVIELEVHKNSYLTLIQIMVSWRGARISLILESFATVENGASANLVVCLNSDI